MRCGSSQTQNATEAILICRSSNLTSSWSTAKSLETYVCPVPDHHREPAQKAWLLFVVIRCRSFAWRGTCGTCPAKNAKRLKHFDASRRIAWAAHEIRRIWTLIDPGDRCFAAARQKRRNPCRISMLNYTPRERDCGMIETGKSRMLLPL